nr:putative carboxylesterase [Kibdelosporangium sp. MJ126-NF4]
MTVCGQSAGAMSIVAMLSGTAGRGLFHRAILQSTPAGMRPQTVEEAQARATQFLGVLDLQPNQLCDLSTSELLAAQQEISRRNAPMLGPVPTFQLVADGEIVADDPLATVGERGADGIPILVGTTRDEATAFRPGAEREAAITESLFAGPTLRLAELLARNGNPAWVYRFDWSAPGNPFGACHCIELPFLLGDRPAWRDAPMLAGADPGELAALTGIMRQAWTSFIHGGQPGVPDWVAYQPQQHAVMHLSTSPEIHKG